MKVMKRSFGFILTVSIFSLIVLFTAVFFLTRDNKTTFKSSGYIISFEKGNTIVDKFEEGTEYKENLNGELVFKNTENKKATSALDNFIHYENGDVAYLQNGVILDLSKINETIIPYYNITNKSLIEKEGNKYIIKTINGNLEINNWLGKISENKYIISGEKLTLKLAGSADILYSSENFFEFSYIENGVVVISDGINTRSATADETYFYIGENTVINLGDKNIYFNNEEKVSLEQITINGDENIDIIPPEEEQKPDNPDEGNNQDGDNDQGGNNGQGDGNNQGQNGGDGTENPDGEDKPEEPEITVTKNPQFKLIEATVTANKMDLLIGVIDTYKVISGDLNISITNMKTAKTVYTSTVSGDSTTIEISTAMGLLEPDTNYIVSIVGNYQTEDLTYERQYFQRVFRTETLGIKLQKDYASVDRLSFLVTMDEKTYVNEFDLTLYDSNNEEVKTEHIIVNDRKEISILFEGLTSNTSYTGVLRNVNYANIIYSDINEDGGFRPDGSYTLALNLKTLKKPPIVSGLKGEVSKDENSVKLSIENIEDVDKGLSKFRYEVYEYNMTTPGEEGEPVKVIETKDAKSVDVPIDGVDLKMNQTYRFKVVVEYYDNEKTVEYEAGYSNGFVSGAAPAIRYVIDEEKTTFKTLVGTFFIEDKNCTVPIEGRECYSEVNNTYIRYYKAGTATVTYYTINVKFDPVTLSAQFEASDLEANTEYVVEVFGDVDLKDGNGKLENIQIGESLTVKTKEIVPLTVNWGEEKISNEEKVFSLGGNQIVSTNNSDAEAEGLINLKINVYGSNSKNIEDGTFIGEITKVSNIKQEFYDNKFKLDSIDTFGLTIDDLKRKTDGLLTRYYIFEITDAYYNTSKNTVPIENNIYAFEIDKNLIADDILGDPEITVELKDGGTGVINSVYVKAKYDRSNLLVLYPDADIKMIMGACNAVTNQCFDLPGVSINDGTNIYEKTFEVGSGTDYYTKDAISADGKLTLFRGNKYKFRFYITVDGDKDGTVDYYYPGRIDKEYVTSAAVSIDKKAPVVNMQIVSSTENSITYSYLVSDGDKTIYKEEGDSKYSLYYRVGEEEKKIEFENFKPGEFTIEGLSNNTRYDIYYKVATIKNGTPEEDVKIGFEGKYTFDGYYNGDNFDLKYSIVNNEISNKVVIKILNTDGIEELIRRISAYQVVIKYKNETIYDKVFTDFKECADDSCLLFKDIKYAEIENYNNKDLKVEVYAVYDNGLIGNTSEIGYLVQQNSNDKGQGTYLVLDENKNVVEATGLPGIYWYDKGTSATNFNLYNIIYGGKLVDYTHPNIQKKLNVPCNKTEEGLKHGNYTINFKTLAKTTATVEGTDIFKFYSITPDVSTSYEPVINGADITIDTTGITKNMLTKGFISEDGKYYIYLELFSEDGNPIDTYKQELILTDENIVGLTNFNIYNLDDATTYKYKLFAKLDKNGEVYTQLNDINTCDEGNCVPVEYTFTTLQGEELFGGVTYNHTSESTEEKYLTRKINFDLTLNNELVNFGKNYDLLINLYEHDEIIGTTTITNDQIIDNANVKFEFDITDSVDAIYGADYFKLELIAITDTTVSDEKVKIYNNFIVLDELRQPLMSATKRANTTKDGDSFIYSIELDVGITDLDKVITNGVYTVKLFDHYDKEVAKIENLSVDELKTIKFATKVDVPDKYNVQVDLVPDKKYNIEISYETYTNNFSLRQEAEAAGQPYENYTKKKNVFNIDVYTTGQSGVSLGDVSITPTANTLVMSFFSSSNLEKVTYMDYSIAKSSDPSQVYASGKYEIGEGKEKNFIAIDDGVKGKYYNFIVDKEGLNFELNTGYIVTFRFYITAEDGSYQPVTTSNNVVPVIRVE